MNARAWALAQETRALGNGHAGSWSDSAAQRIQQRYLRPHAAQAEELVRGLDAQARSLEVADTAVRDTHIHYEEARAAGDEVIAEIERAEYAISMTHDSARRAHSFDTRAEQLEREAVAAAMAADQVCAGIPGEHGQTILGVRHHGIGDREAALRGARGLTQDELALIRAYTGENAADPGSYPQVNPLMRVGTIAELEASAATITALQHAIQRCPTYQGVVFRGTDLQPHQLARYVPGQRVVEQAFMSASADPHQAFHGNTLYVINSRTGHDVAGSSTISSEAEVLYGHSQAFVVLSNSYVASLGRNLIVLREVGP